MVDRNEMVTSVIELYEQLEAERALVRELREELRRDDRQARAREIRNGFVGMGREQAYKMVLNYSRSVDAYSGDAKPLGFAAWCERSVNRTAMPSFISYDEFLKEFSAELNKEYSDQLSIYLESNGQKDPEGGDWS